MTLRRRGRRTGAATPGSADHRFCGPRLFQTKNRGPQKRRSALPASWPARSWSDAPARQCGSAEVSASRRIPLRPLVREEDPSRQVERIERPRPVEGARQQGEVRLGESLSPFEEAHGDEEIGKEGTPEFRHRDRIRHGGDGGQGKDADRKSGGPRYPLRPVLWYSPTQWTWKKMSTFAFICKLSGIVSQARTVTPFTLATSSIPTSTTTALNGKARRRVGLADFSCCRHVARERGSVAVAVSQWNTRW